MKKILSFVLSGFLLFSNMAPVYAQAVSQPGAASSPVSEQFNPAELVASLNEIYAQFEAAAANETESPSGMEAGSEEENKAVLAQIGKAVFLLYETPGYKSQAEDLIFKLFPFIAPFLEEEERQKGVRVLHKFILACEDGTEDTCQRSLDAAVILGLMGRFDKDSEEAIALVNFLKVGENTPLYPYIIQAVGQTLLAVAPGVLVDAVMGKVKTSPSYGFFSGEYTLDVHSLMTKVFVGNGFSRGMERSYYPSDKGGHNFRNAWSNLGRFWAKEASSDSNLRNELNRLLAWCIEDEASVRFKPFVAGVLSTGYIYKNAKFSQSVAKHMFQMRKGDLDPFTATYMENLLAVGFHKLGGQDDGFNKLLTFQNKLTPEGKRALLSEHKCPSVSDFNEEVNLNELPRGSICQWRYASLDKINTNSLQLLTVDVVGHAIDAIGLVFGVAGLAKLSVSGAKNLKAIFRFIKTHRMAGQSYKEISKILFRLSRIKVTSAYHSLVASVRNAYRGLRYGKLKIASVLSDLDTASTNMSSGSIYMQPFLSELKTALAGLSNEISHKDLGKILEKVFNSNDFLLKLLKHPAAINEMKYLLKNKPHVVAEQFLAILKNQQFWQADGFKYFEILDGKTLIPVVEIAASATKGDVMSFAEWVLRINNVDKITFKLSNIQGLSVKGTDLLQGEKIVGSVKQFPSGKCQVTLNDPVGDGLHIYNKLLAAIRQDASVGKITGIFSGGESPHGAQVLIQQLYDASGRGVLRLKPGEETNAFELLADLWLKTRSQFSGNVPANGWVKVRFTSAEVPPRLDKMHVHLEAYDPVKGFLYNEKFVLHGTINQHNLLMQFFQQQKLQHPSGRFDVFELQKVKDLLSSADIPVEEITPAAQYADMFA